MNRRHVIVGLALAPLAAASGALRAQKPEEKVWRVAVLMYGAPANFRRRADAFRKGLQELGYVEGRNVRLEWHSANGQADLLQQQAEQVARSKPDVILSSGTDTTRSLLDARVAAPIVMGTVDDPVASGFARSLARPGANVTGLTTSVVDQAPRFLELLAQALERTSRVAFLANPKSSTYRAYNTRLERAAAKLGARIDVRDASNTEAIVRAFAGARDDDGMIVMSDTLFVNERIHIVELAAGARLPVIYPQSTYVEIGGLMSYGPNFEDNYRRAAFYVDRIFKGGNPREMAIEPPTRYELLVNRATAARLDLQIPPAFLKKADRIVG